MTDSERDPEGTADVAGDEGAPADGDRAEQGRGGGGAARPADTRRLRGQPRAAELPASVAERAVRVDDRVSGVFVIAVVAVFALIFANAILFGHSGFVTGLFPTPTPVVTPSPSPAPSSAAPSSAAPSPSAAAPSSAAPSPSSSAAPSPSASAAASGSDAPPSPPAPSPSAS